MEDSQRQAMYDGWARGKKWAKVKVTKLDKDRTHSGVHGHTWEACVEDAPFGCVYRQSKIAVIQRIQGMLAERGYEISNLSELFSETPSGVKLAAKSILDGAKERRTFLEWLQATKKSKGKFTGLDRLLPPDHEGRFLFNNEIPQHKLKDPSLTEKINEDYYRKKIARQKKLQKEIAECDNIHKARRLFDDYMKERDKETVEELRRIDVETREKIKWEKFFNDIQTASEVHIKMPDGEIKEYPSRAKRRALNDLSYNK